MHAQALIVGNSDGIGLATTKRLLTAGWKVMGISKSDATISDNNYHHQIADVSEATYLKACESLRNEA